MKAVYEKVKVSDQTSIAVFQNEEKEFSAPWHFHPEYELTYIHQSSGIRYVGNHVQAFDAGELVLLGSKLPHCWKNHEEAIKPAKSIVIHWLPDMLNHIPEFDGIESLLERSARGILFEANCAERSRLIMTALLGESSIERYLMLLELLSSLAKEKVVTVLVGSSYAYDLSYDTGERFNKIMAFVKINYHRKIRLIEMADLASMTEQSFSRFFSKNMKRPFFEYLNEFRVNIAGRMLVETDRPVTEIGFLCGYETLPFFYKQFKKFKQYSPLAFRKLYAKSLH